MDGSGSGVSRRDFLRAAGVAGALGVSGSLLGARAALGHNENRLYLRDARAVWRRLTTWLSSRTPSTGREGDTTVTRVRQAQAGGRV